MKIEVNKIKTLPMVIGFFLLQEIKKEGKASIYTLYDILKKNGLLSSRQLIIGLSFLYSLDLIEFEEANVWIKK